VNGRRLIPKAETLDRRVWVFGTHTETFGHGFVRETAIVDVKSGSQMGIFDDCRLFAKANPNGSVALFNA
jgi:hypothetical protein